VWLSVSALWLLLAGSMVSNGWGQATLETEVESKLVKSVVDETFKASNARNMNLLLASDRSPTDGRDPPGELRDCSVTHHGPLI
jgi:hypothetical protein